MIRKMIPAVLSLIMLGAAAAPTLAQPRRYRHWRDRGYTTRDYRGLGVNERRVADRAARLYREGRLSRDHYERTMGKLHSRRGADWADQVNDTLTRWSDADSRNGRWRR